MAFTEFDDSISIVQLSCCDSVDSQSQSMQRRMQAIFDDEEDTADSLSNFPLRPPATLPIMPENRGPPSICLAVLIDFVVQKILHELTILSDLLPKKLDSDRKISIVHFANSTRMLFIRLLAVVKWVKTAKKVESCTTICFFLEQQAAYFVETADKLVFFARDELVNAKMPAFQIPSAVDVLSLGRFPRLPVCLRSKFVADSHLSIRERALLLRRLDQLVQFRLSLVAAQLPSRIRQCSVGNGFATLTVPGEFGVVQARMSASSTPLMELYRILHWFCQDLQLDLLYCQTTTMIANRSGPNLVVDQYKHGQQLVVGYWQKTQKTRMCCDSVFHCSLPVGVPSSACRLVGPNPMLVKGVCSLPRLISLTLSIRCRQRLSAIRSRIHSLLGVRSSLSGDALPTLGVPLSDIPEECTDQLLRVSVSVFDGIFVVGLAALGDCPELRQLEVVLNDGLSDRALLDIIDRLRILLTMEQTRQSTVLLPVRLISEAELLSHSGKLNIIYKDRLYLQFVKNESYYLILTFVADEFLGVRIDFYLLSTTTKMQSNLVQLKPSQLVEFIDESSHSVDVDGQPQKKKRRSQSCVHSELSAAIRTVDDRVAFLGICEELDRKEIKYQQVQVEFPIGGLKLDITSFGPSMSIPPCDFLDHLVRCSIRLDVRTRIAWTLECLFIDPPLIGECDDCTVMTNTKAVVSEIPLSHANASGELVAGLVDRMVVYGRLYDVVARFARGETTHMIKILAYTFHKLVLAYGTDRSLLLTLSWKPTPAYFHLGFGVRHSDRANPHSTMASILGARFNRQPDLNHLVHLLDQTARPLGLLHRFVRVRLQSTRTQLQQQLPGDCVPLALRTCLIPINETTVRLHYGPIAWEWLVLTGNRLGVRDCSAGQTTPISMCLFWAMYTNPDLDTGDSSPVFGTAPKFASSPIDTDVNPLTPNSARPPETVHVSEQRGPILIDCDALMQVTAWSSKASCPLDSYLFAICYMLKLSAVLTSCSRELPIRNLQLADSIKFHVPTLNDGLVAFHIFVDVSSQPMLKLKLDYSGSACPSQNDILLAEKFFILQVAPLGGHELALLSFISICRLPSNGPFPAMTQFMLSQMEPPPNQSLWKPSIDLISKSIERDVPEIERRPICGVQIYSKGKNTVKVLLCVRLRSSSDISTYHSVPLIYDIASNSIQTADLVKMDPSSTTNQLLQQQSETGRKVGDCCIWPAVKALAEYFDPNNR